MTRSCRRARRTAPSPSPRQGRRTSVANDNEELEYQAPEPEEELEVPENALATVRRLWEAMAGLRWRIVACAVSAVLYVAATLAAVGFSASVVDMLWNKIQASFSAGEPFTLTLENGGLRVLTFLGIWTAAWVFYSFNDIVMASFAERLNLSLREKISAKVSRLPLSYFDAHQPGDTISRATNDLDKLSEVLQRGVLQLLTSVMTVAGAVLVMLTVDVRLTCIFLAFAAVALVVTKLFAGRTIKVAAARQASLGTLTGRIEEAYSGRTVIKAFGRDEASAVEIEQAAQRLAATSASSDFLTNAVGPAIRFVMRLCQVTIAVLAGQMLIAGQLSVGVFQAFFQYVTSASEPLTQLGLTVNMLQGALAAAERVFRLLDEDEVEPDPVCPLAPVEPVRGRVAFEHVRFGYSADKPLMRDVSLVAEPGQKVAIVGATGAGKTTLINLLMRFYEVDGGRITLDGVDTRQMRAADLRREFGMVLQDAWLFEGTIADNIAYGRADATREEVVAAAKAAHVDYFIRTLPQGYDTVLANDAEAVSAGQRQLLTIARAMLCDPAILILDEATSSVDTRTEQAIVHAMETLMSGRTSFVIAHRLSTIVDADLILVMDHGTIVEQGTHDELMAAGGAYADLYLSQFA
ncbi:ABC transporter ATP-binding protein [uncultured Parolsenella sp.]|uniref:ABC transporter ATP-binding protein n=1 Tax=uncultured Parolsenella sp. TaxID=2083008 RepID=UPI0035A93D06